MNVLQYYKQYLQSSKDEHAHLYEVQESPYQIPLSMGGVSFGEGKHKITILDQFGGKRPLLMNLDFLRHPTDYQLKVIPSIILDSHVASALHVYVNDSKSLAPPAFRSISDFLLFVSKNNIDYNPFFYLIESFFKSEESKFTKYVTPVMETILNLHCMDDDHFVKTREILIKEDAVEYYKSLHGGASLRECAERWVDQITKDEDFKKSPSVIEASYACLLKMVLINKKDSSSILKKLEEFVKFIEVDLGFPMAREPQLAVHYFADLAGSFVGVQANTKVADAKRMLRASAWDLLLLSMPEIVIGPKHLPEMTVAYIATAEKKLSELASLFMIERVIARSDDTEALSPEISFNLTDVKKKIGVENSSKIVELTQKRLQERLPQKKGTKKNFQQLNFLVEDLEIQLSYLCRG